MKLKERERMKRQRSKNEKRDRRAIFKLIIVSVDGMDEKLMIDQLNI